MIALFLNLFLRSAIICLAAAVLRRLFPRYAARERHALLLAAFLLLFVWPLLALLLPEFDVSFLAGESAEDGSVTIQHSMHAAVHPLRRSNFVYLPVALWLLGVVCSLLPLMRGFLKARAISRRAIPLDHADAYRFLESLCAHYEMASRPQLLVMTESMMPFLFGIRRPKILLPVDAATWSGTRWRTVLSHELAHIRRRDVATQMFAHWITALWWFQPLCHLNYMALRQESERACDAMALTSGIKASDYAEELLQLARPSQQRGHSSSAVMMAGRGNLEPRVQAILDFTAKRQVLHFFSAAIVFLVVLTLTASAVTVKEGNSMKRTLLASLLTSAGLSAATIGGTLFDSNGAAIPNATASLYNPDTTIAQQTATAIDGKFSFSVPAGQYILRIQKPGFPSLFREFNVQEDTKIERRLAFSQPATADGETPHEIRVPGGAQQAKLVQKVNPIYPVSAKQAHLQGSVSLEAVISAEGVPEDITVLSSPGDDLTQSALEAVRQWRYSTTLLNGNPIAVVTNIIVNYTLSQ